MDDLIERIVKIKPGVTTWVDGLHIPDYTLNGCEKLYIEKVTCNGNAVVVASEDRLLIRGVLSMSAVEVLDETLTFHDEIKELPNLELRIIGVESRMKNISRNSKRFSISDDNIFIDKVHMGCKENARRAWGVKTDKSHIGVINDDVEFSDNFLSYIAKILELFPDRIISILPQQFLDTGEGRYAKIPKTPYVSNPKVAGCAVIMPVDLVKIMLDKWDDKLPGDDSQMEAMIQRGEAKPAITTLPSLIQHMGQISVYNPDRSLGRTTFFRKNAKEFDWDNTYVTPVSNIIR